MVASVGFDRAGCLYHRLPLIRPPADAPDLVATMSAESRDIVWLFGPFWIDPDNRMGKPAMLLQQRWAPPCRPIWDAAF